MRTLKVQGIGRVSAEPDMVTLTFAVEARNQRYEECHRSLNTRAEDLRASLTAAGLDRAKVKTSDYNVRVETQYEDGRNVFVGYAATHRMEIELSADKDLLARALWKVAQGQSGTEIGLSFSVADKDALRRQVIAQAVRTATDNAEAIAAAAGITLGPVLRIEYGREPAQVFAREASMVMKASADAAAFDAGIEPGDVVSEESVTLVYEIGG